MSDQTAADTPGAAPDASPDDINQCLNGGSCPTGTFPWGFIPGTFKNIQLDIVGFLAILGEATVLNNAQVAALSWTAFLPRLIPAPQALLRTSRPERLDPTTGLVVGPHSGNIRRHVNHVADILHQVAFHKHKLGSSDMKPYQVRAITIDWADESSEDRDIGSATKAATPGHQGHHEQRQKRRKLKANFKAFGPLAGLAYFGCAQSVALLVYSVLAKDGMSVLATIILSLVATMTGVANHWKLELPTRTEQRGNLPPSDVIISYPNGSFLVVTCPEEISRIYFQSEQCAYSVDTWKYRGICLLGTILLMLGVICLANSTQDLQITWATMYIAINAAYWAVAALPARTHWNMEGFKTEVVDFKWYKYEKNKGGPGYQAPELLDGKEGSQNPSYTEALWKAIGVTGGSHWARTADAAPDTNGWDVWLRQAEHALEKVKLDENTAEEKMSHAGSPTVEVASQDSDAEKGKRPDPKTIQLPAWNYREALTQSLNNTPNKSRWRDMDKQ